MKIAYLILCHTDPNHIKRLTNKITKDSGNEAFVHVDGKSDIAPFEHALKDNAHVHMIKQRFNVYWGGVRIHRSNHRPIPRGSFHRIV